MRSGRLSLLALGLFFYFFFFFFVMNKMTDHIFGHLFRLVNNFLKCFNKQRKCIKYQWRRKKLSSQTNFCRHHFFVPSPCVERWMKERGGKKMMLCHVLHIEREKRPLFLLHIIIIIGGNNKREMIPFRVIIIFQSACMYVYVFRLLET
ncbi:hypothetical protein QBC38DRAFT_470657 [Podospora fimiseda]|uniref:Uncharacterized protein n=1 Tax=Podospora fimiseda TaxID=252190 RepID=A0AAN7BUK1_9PEZI|nr:hypothetical protein QBC38DRAFT_470657 [Podospora fimiseda]